MMSEFHRGFQEEREKIAISLHEHHEPGLLSMHGLAGKHTPYEKLIAENPALAKQLGVPAGSDLLAMAPKEEFVKAYGPQGEEAYKAIRRHELTHYLRSQRGKMKRVGTPGLRGLGATAREELIAHLSSMKRRSLPVQQSLAVGTVPGVLESVRSAYPGQRLRDVAKGGTVKRVLGLLKKVR